MDKKVHIVVVTYNRCKLLEECLHALLEQDYNNFVVYLINNGSTDQTEKIIKSKFIHPNIKYFNTGNNLGGAGGFNYGMRLAAKDSCDYIWLMDDDTIVDKEALSNLVNYASSLNDNFGFLSGNVRFIDGTPCKMNIPTTYKDKQHAGRTWLENYDAEKSNDVIRLSHATFVSFFVRTKVVLEVGLPIKEFFIWADDTEYSLRISKKYPCYFCGKSIVIHKMKVNASTSANDFVNGDPERIPRYFYAYRNRFYVAKHQGFKKTVFYIIKFMLTTFQILFNAKNEKKNKLKILWSAFFKGLKFNPLIEYVTNND